ncbi:MAG: hypothetical protein EOO03_09950 [Chitinophagaceae bacterium]|nr:MAG: hypothetical protein EOO03_09950 [Chitinophagaceae bacterium]
MGFRKISVRIPAAESISSIALFIESKGLLQTAEKFIDGVYDYFEKLRDNRKSYAECREATRKMFGYKCVSYKKKYTIVFIETDEEIIICEFIPSKMVI